MKKTQLLAALFVLVLLAVPAAIFASSNEVTGLWKTIDDTTGKPKGVIAVYDYNGKVFGRVLCSFDDDGLIDDDLYRKINRSPFIVGDPPFNGLTIIWDMKQRGNKWVGGKIMDPGDKEIKPGIYDCEIWREGEKLIVRGQILFFGRNQTWLPFRESDFPDGFKVPDWKNFRPEIPKLK